MASFDQSVNTGGLVVNTSGGKYSGGACPDQGIVKALGCAFQGFGDQVLTMGLGKPVVNSAGDIDDKRWWAGFAIGLFLISLFVLMILARLGVTRLPAYLPLIGSEGFEGRGYEIANSGPGMRFAGSNSQVGLGVHNGFTQEDRAAEYARQVSDSFINSREQPYFPDVTNRVLRMENREKEAVRALGKINQERLRRAAEDTSSTTPLPWGPFWKEWKSTHPLDGEDVASGFEDDNYAAGFALPY